MRHSISEIVNSSVTTGIRMCSHLQRSPPPGPFVKPDFPSVVGEWQAASARLVKELDRLVPNAFEFLPFRTRTSTGEDVTVGYSLLHYLKWVDAVDRRRSQLAEGETPFRRLRETCEDYNLDRVVLSRRRLVDPVCRIRGWSPYHLYREDIVDALKSMGFSGLDFDEVEVA